MLIQVCKLTTEDYCDPGNAADWASSATVYSTTIRWRVVITNTGTGPLTGIYVTSSLVPKQSDCAGPVKAHQLKAGAVIAYECESDHISAPATIIQTVTASADPQGRAVRQPGKFCRDRAGSTLYPTPSGAISRTAAGLHPAEAGLLRSDQGFRLGIERAAPSADGRVAGRDHQHRARWRSATST